MEAGDRRLDRSSRSLAILAVSTAQPLVERKRSRRAKTADAHKIARRARTGVLAALAVLLVALTMATELGFGPEPRGGRPEAAIVSSPS